MSDNPDPEKSSEEISSLEKEKKSVEKNSEEIASLDKEKKSAEENEKFLAQGVEDYGSDSIKVLEGLEAVRKRPAMYIGSTSSAGLHHLVYEVVDNSIDEALAGYCNEVSVTIHSDNSITVVDNGRGIPVGFHDEQQKSSLEVTLTTLHAGAKFENSAYKVSGGLHGVGVSVVNALSEKMKVEVFRNGIIYSQEYSKGDPTTSVDEIGKTTKKGTKVWFLPDSSIFEETVYSYEILANRLRELSFLNKNIRILLVDEREGREDSFYSEDGIKSFVEHLNQNKNTLHRDIIYIHREIPADDGTMTSVETALQWHDGYNETIYTYANNIHTRDGGTHLSGLRSSLTRSMNAYAKKENLVKEKLVLSGEDWREGLTCVLSVKIGNPQFEGQTKQKLGNREIQGAVESIINEYLSMYLEENPASSKSIVSKAVEAAHVRAATKKVRDLERQRKSPLHSGGLPGKLADCSSRDVETTELYLVEGDSAGGSAKSGRDRRFQAILPLKGKILNVEKARFDKILGHNEIQMIMTAIGSGLQEDFDVTKRRYGKLVIMTDADIDGSHIRTLLLTFFFRQMRPLVEGGHVYIAQPPLYKFAKKRKSQYVYSDREFENALMEFGVEESKVRFSKEGECLEGEDLKNFLHVLLQTKRQLNSLTKYGIGIREFLPLRHPDTQDFPIYEYMYSGETGYFYTESEYEEFFEEKLQEREEEIPIVSKYRVTNGNNPLILTKIYESREISRLIKKLEEQEGVSLANYLRKEKKVKKEKFEIVTDNDTIAVYSLLELVDEIQTIGRKGLDVQRYKGLGEMNPDQLWTTTMDPETRTLFQVTIEDGIEAERLFSVLMGNVVEPRRDFIEKHALEVQNLDV